MTYSDDQLDKLYEEFSGELSWIEISEKLKEFEHEEKSYFQRRFLYELLHQISEGYMEYEIPLKYEENSFIDLFLKNCERFPESNYYQSVYYAIKGDKKKCFEYLLADDKEFYMKEENKDYVIDEGGLAEIYLIPFKNLIPGFYIELSKIISLHRHDEGIVELTLLFEDFYKDKNLDRRIELIQSFIEKHPVLKVPKEMLGTGYMARKMWKNAIACFEQVESDSFYYYYTPTYLNWQMACCFGKIHDLSNEEKYYREVYKDNPHTQFVKNNLAYYELVSEGKRRYGRYGYVCAGRIFVRKDKLVS